MPPKNLPYFSVATDPSRILLFQAHCNSKPHANIQITDYYLKRKQLKVGILDRGTAWLDTGTFSSLNEASQFVETLENRQGLMIGAIEEVAYRMGFIDADQLRKLAEPLLKSGYGRSILASLDQ